MLLSICSVNLYVLVHRRGMTSFEDVPDILICCLFELFISLLAGVLSTHLCVAVPCVHVGTTRMDHMCSVCVSFGAVQARFETE